MVPDTAITETESFLRAPYPRVIVYDDTTHTYTGLISEFPGCIVQADSAAACLERLELAAREWLTIVIDDGSDYALPPATTSYLQIPAILAALNFYADPDTWKSTALLKDNGKRARDVLGRIGAFRSVSVDD